jgi:hypothetical protein
MEKSTIAKLCELLSSIMNVFSKKSIKPVDNKPVNPINTSTNIIIAHENFIDEKAQIERSNIEQNAILNESDPC